MLPPLELAGTAPKPGAGVGADPPLLELLGAGPSTGAETGPGRGAEAGPGMGMVEPRGASRRGATAVETWGDTAGAKEGAAAGDGKAAEAAGDAAEAVGKAAEAVGEEPEAVGEGAEAVGEAASCGAGPWVVEALGRRTSLGDGAGAGPVEEPLLGPGPGARLGAVGGTGGGERTGAGGGEAGSCGGEEAARELLLPAGACGQDTTFMTTGKTVRVFN